MRPEVFSREQVQAWEQRWFAAGNSSYGLMQQAAWQMTQHIVQYIDTLKQEQALEQLTQVSAGIWCGAGNNGGDGWLLAGYLKQAGLSVWVLELEPPQTDIAKQAKAYAMAQQVEVYTTLKQLAAIHVQHTTLQVDALLGIGLNREVGGLYQAAIAQFNQCSGTKVAVDIPSGLHANSGAVLGIACEVNLTLTVLGLKAGLLTGQGPAYTGKVVTLSLIPPDDQLQALARLDQQLPKLPKRRKTGHKGTYGHVLIVGGDETMGGAAIMAAEAALASGAGKVTLLMHEKHHSAALSRCPNVMTLSMPVQAQITPEFVVQISQGMDCIVIGMGLGRHDWSKAVWQAFLPVLEQAETLSRVVIDADALWHLSAWHLADEQDIKIGLHQHWYCTPHSGEAARLLGVTVQAIEQDRIAAIYALKYKFGGNWLLKGAGSLSLDTVNDIGLSICGLGNPGMATAGMGDILAGMAGGLLAQLPNLPLHDIVALHAAAGDLLAEKGERGLQAPQMLDAIKVVVN